MPCALPIRSEEHTSELQSHDNLGGRRIIRSEEHTPELQSHDNLVCRLLLEKKNTHDRFASDAAGNEPIRQRLAHPARKPLHPPGQPEYVHYRCVLFLFFFNVGAPADFYPLPLPDALPS